MRKALQIALALFVLSGTGLLGFALGHKEGRGWRLEYQRAWTNPHQVFLSGDASGTHMDAEQVVIKMRGGEALTVDLRARQNQVVLFAGVYQVSCHPDRTRQLAVRAVNPQTMLVGVEKVRTD